MQNFSFCLGCHYRRTDTDSFAPDSPTIGCAVYPSEPTSNCPDRQSDDWALLPDQFIDRYYMTILNQILSQNPEHQNWTVVLLTLDKLQQLHQLAVEQALDRGVTVPFEILRHYMNRSQIVWNYVREQLNLQQETEKHAFRYPRVH